MSIPPGNVSFGNVLDVLPFSNFLVVSRYGLPGGVLGGLPARCALSRHADRLATSWW